jgi:PEP-CTERM motif
MKTGRIALVAVLACALTAPAYAASWTTSYASWIGGVTNPYLTDFNDVTTDQSFFSSPTTYRDLTFSVSLPGFNGADLGNKIDASPFLINNDPFYTPDGSTYVAVDLVPNSMLTIEFATDQTDFGTTFLGLANGARSATFQLFANNGSLLDTYAVFNRPNTAPPEQLFVGVSSPVAFRKLALTFTPTASGPVNDFFGFDNVWLSSASAVPEPGTWGMMIGGFGCLGGALRVHRRRRATPANA